MGNPKALACWFVLIPALARAQTLPLLSRHDLPYHLAPEAQVFGLGDVDGDAASDYAVLGRGLLPGPLGLVSKVISGRTGTMIHDLLAMGIGGGAGFFRVSDHDGDGLDDIGLILNPVPFAGSLTVRSGASLALLLYVPLPPSPFPCAIAELGDLTGDGISEIGIAGVSLSGGIASAPLPTSYPDVVDGSSGSRSNLVTISGLSLPSGGLASVGDVDGDGVPDFAGSSGASSFVALDGGSATVFSGLTGTGLQTWTGLAGDRLGEVMVAVGDVDGDGARDVALFAPGADIIAINTGRICVHSSGSGALLFDVLPGIGEKITGLFAAGDQDGDGLEDLGVEITTFATTVARRELRSAAMGAFISTLGAGDFTVGDLNGDRIADLVNLAIGTPAPTQTRLQARTLLGGGSYGTPMTSASAHWIPGFGRPSLGLAALTGAPASISALAVVSLSPANTVVPGTILPLLVSTAPADLVSIFPIVTNVFGEWSGPVDLATPGLAGLRVYAQFGFVTPSPTTTDAIELRFGPY